MQPLRLWHALSNPVRQDGSELSVAPLMSMMDLDRLDVFCSRHQGRMAHRRSWASLQPILLIFLDTFIRPKNKYLGPPTKRTPLRELMQEIPMPSLSSSSAQRYLVQRHLSRSRQHQTHSKPPLGQALIIDRLLGACQRHSVPESRRVSYTRSLTILQVEHLVALPGAVHLVTTRLSSSRRSQPR